MQIRTNQYTIVLVSLRAGFYLKVKFDYLCHCHIHESEVCKVDEGDMDRDDECEMF